MSRPGERTLVGVPRRGKDPGVGAEEGNEPWTDSGPPAPHS